MAPYHTTMKKEDALSEDFLEQFKNEEELYTFLSRLQKRGVGAIVEVRKLRLAEI